MTISIQPYIIAGKQFKLVFDWLEEKGGYGYTLYVNGKDREWNAVSARGNSLVKGKSFDLYPSAITIVTADQEWKLTGTGQALNAQKEAITYPWEASITYDSSNDWLKVKVNVNSDQNIALQMIDGVEPELTIDMGLLPPYDRGDHVWFKTSINNPTKWNDEAYGNDCPAMYYYDSYYHFDLMMYFDMTDMSWMSRDNIARFLNYRCGFRRRYKPSPAYELGLYADGFSGYVFPAGEQTFTFYLKARKQLSSPTETTALKELMDHCLQLVPAEAEWPEKATDWEDFTERCTTDLMDPQCWNSNDTFDDFILNYVNGYSPAWQEAFESKNLTIDFTKSPCIDSAVFIGYPLAIVDAVKPNRHYTALLDRILAFIRTYVGHKVEDEQARKNSGNAVFRDGVIGTWQFVYILEQTWQIAYLKGEQDLLDYAQAEIEDVLIPLSRNVNYLFPLSFNMGTLRKHGNGDAYMVAGIYAYFMVSLYKATGKPLYLEEASRAIKPLLNMPVSSLSQEVFMFGLGIQAASELHKLTGDGVYKEIYEYLVAQNLRMMYWFNDNTKEEYQSYNTFAMFQACTPIIYPAFFENIECLARIASTLDTLEASKGLLRVFNHARKNNLYMFPQCLPENRHSSSLMYIPFENLGVLEDEKTGWIGQEIYGCGQVYQAYLMWEAFGKSSDRDILLLNLNNYKIADLNDVQHMGLAFIAYNPEAVEKTFDIVWTESAANRTVWISKHVDDANPSEISVTEGRITLTLKPDEHVYIKVETS
ncbi:hypothetical protein Back11_55580 [Paenibacillus baekrokdamisoli]|uniref:Uncharacterized protein n=1 Tax=Paenibacillus baekrokdamisoli TaxID=1712516 RepID=A0A3G9JGV2_9BACL|nr:hypothetical protein [Paenibacillus baekrokdamisoli]MBB3071804.1 hypothetical protein [Paenibacillus baekrokdamisoli]BBH24213.1 hypothetical protein Back11_55580 [Paenibacillus baekrokdamisoli]